MTQQSCKNCKHRTEIETVPGVWVSLTEGRCRQFVSSKFDRITGEEIQYLPCHYAMDTFCHLTAWKPRTWLQRIGDTLC